MLPVSVSMANVPIAPELRVPVRTFVANLKNNPTELLRTVEGAADPRARLGRLDDGHAIVFYELLTEANHHFIYGGAYPLEEAAARARAGRVEVNPVNGVTSLVTSAADAAPAAAPARTPLVGAYLDAHGLSAEVLHAELGLPSTTVEAARASTEADLDTALAGRPAWEIDALRHLLAGNTLAETRGALGLTLAPTPVANTDATAYQGLLSDAAQMQLLYLDDPDADSLRAVIESQDFNRWRVFLHPTQRAIVTRNYSGSGRVFGGAGTGKTVVALHRANHLVTAGGDAAEPPRVLLTTFTKVLAASLRASMEYLNASYPEATQPGEPGLWITGIDALVVQVVRRAARAEMLQATREVLGREVPRLTALNNDAENALWREVLSRNPDHGLAEPLADYRFLAEEYESVVVAQGITTQAQYLRVSRVGRGTALNRAARKAVWALIADFVTACAHSAAVPWSTLAAVGARVLAQRGPVFDHVVVDEAQDFHAGHWLFLRACVAPGRNDIFLAEDTHQRIYGQHYVLSRFGIATRGRASTRLTVNYRTTRENLGYALHMLDGAQWVDADGVEDTAENYRSSRSGPRPEVLRFAAPDEELAAVVRKVQEWQEADSGVRIGILSATRQQRDTVTQRLGAAEIAVANSEAPRKGRETAAQPAVLAMTMHSAKGMEFNNVILYGVGADVLPAPYRWGGLPAAEAADRVQRERALLYVAATRARDALVVTTHGEPSPLLPG